jgi:hypothetical protein
MCGFNDKETDERGTCVVKPKKTNTFKIAGVERASATRKATTYAK